MSGFNGKANGKTYGGAKRVGAGSATPPRRGGTSRPARPVRPVDPDAPVRAPSGLGWREAIVTTVTGLGYELVDIERAQRGLLRVTIDRIPGRTYSVPSEAVTVEDCEQVTRQLQYVLEVESLEYTRLEVSSPGLDRPLKTEADFQRFEGMAVQVTLKEAFQKRKSWQGVLSAAEGGGWNLTFKEGKTDQVFGFKFDEVREARLVPVVDFKGRKSKGVALDVDPADGAPVQGDAAAVQGG